MVRQPDATVQPAPQDMQLMSKHRVLSFKPQLRLEWRGQDGQSETEQPDHSASLGDSITASTRIRFSVHTKVRFWREAAVGGIGRLGSSVEVLLLGRGASYALMCKKRYYQTFICKRGAV